MAQATAEELKGSGLFEGFEYEILVFKPFVVVMTRVPDITAVRTADAKLIKYRGHRAWTELFDLKADPYEIRNLINDPAAAQLKAKMLAEHERLSKEVSYRVPDFVDRPPNWGQPGSLAGDMDEP